jgi:SPP1 gp7 family putative phage head morphogenesis protein
MCGLCATDDDHLLLVHEAGKFLDTLLEGIADPVTKAIDLRTKAGFDRAVSVLAAKLGKQSGPADAAAVRAAIAELDIDWRNSTKEQRSKAINDARVAAGKATAIIPTRIGESFGDRAKEIVGQTKKDVRAEHKLNVSLDMNALDKRIVQHLTRTQGNFVRDEYGRRVDDFGATAKAIVASSLEQGLGRDDIAEKLSEAAQSVLVNRAKSYWTTIAGAFVANARSYAQMSSYAEAGIRRYQILAVLDEVTTEQCRFLDGKEFSVGTALDRFDRIDKASDPEQIKSIAPWIRVGTNEDGARILYTGKGESRTQVAEITRSGVGAKDDRGEYRGALGEKALDELGVGFPPYHGHCRTTTVPV